MPHREPLFPAAGPLAIGDHVWPWRRMMPTGFYAFTISAPGWRSGGDSDVPGGGRWIEKGTPGTPDGAIITFGHLNEVYADPCGHTLTDPQTSPSDLADAVAAIPGIELISGPTTTPGGDHQVTFRIPTDIDCDPQEFYLWTADGRPRAARELGSTITISIIDGPSWDGQPRIVEAETYEGATPELQKEVQQIVDSFGPSGGGIG